MISTTPIAIRQADLADLDAVQRISAGAYIRLYGVLGVIPSPPWKSRFKDIADFIDAGTRPRPSRGGEKLVHMVKQIVIPITSSSVAD